MSRANPIDVAAVAARFVAGEFLATLVKELGMSEPRLRGLLRAHLGRAEYFRITERNIKSGSYAGLRKGFYPTTAPPTADDCDYAPGDLCYWLRKSHCRWTGGSRPGDHETRTLAVVRTRGNDRRTLTLEGGGTQAGVSVARLAPYAGPVPPWAAAEAARVKGRTA